MEVALEDQDPRSKGGRARSEKLTPDRLKEIARKGGVARWADLPRAVDEGVLAIGDKLIPCAVLEDKRRVLTQSGVMKSLGRARQAKGRSYYDGDVNLPAFITAKNLKAFIPSDLYVTSSQIEFRRKTGGKAFGYPAELLPKVCNVFLNAEAAGVLTKAQKPIAANARLLLQGFAHIGIVALVDEATGYQYKRPVDDLQKILAAYISPTLLPWTEKFPMDFFKEMFRVYGWAWPYTPENYPGPVGPRYAGKLIKKIIFENLPPGVLAELERLNPADAKWQRKNRMAQLLSSGIGHPHIEKLVAVTHMLFKVSEDRNAFKKHYAKAFPKIGDQAEFLLEPPR
jgi:hypothetical protein